MESGAVKDGSNDVADKDASQAVQVAVHVRPLIALERIQGCKECISVVPGEPQVQLGAHSFTFDHVYGSGAASPLGIFDQCVLPLVEGLFQGYNATVLAYGQTGSGKTYTMGTGYTVGGNTGGVIPQVMEMLFKKIDSMKHKADFQLRVSFIEILKEEVHDLLDPNPPSTIKPDNATHGGVLKVPSGKPPIQIRETGTGGIILAGVTETEVRSLAEMAACLEQGSLCRATGSTNMNSQSSRSHAIFTINVEQRRKWDSFLNGDSPLPEDTGEDFLCAKLHLVDLAGSERAKRTKADGNRFKEGVHINRGLLALGNVISALGDDKKRKEGGHVPYRDSKLTRLLQDSLGGNSRTVMIACVSPADSNAEETLNTLKYANRARNIQNKPTVNRDPVAAEMQRMRQQLEVLQAELLCARATSIPEEIQLLKQKVVWLETSNMELRRELQQSAEGCGLLSQQVFSAQVERDKLQLKIQKMHTGNEELGEDDTQNEDLVKSYLTKIQELELELQHAKSFRSKPIHNLEGNISDTEDLSGDAAVEGEEDVAVKELEHSMMQDCLDKELQELDKRLELKEAEMKAFARPDNVILKQHFEKKLMELEDEKKSLQRERDTLLKDLEALASTNDEHTQKMQETYVQKLKDLEHQIAELKKKQESQAQLLRQKQRSDEAAKRLQDEILRMKQQKVQLQNKIKQESEQFRAWKTSREKEVLQLKKEGRRNEYEMHKLQALHQRQKMVLQRKTEEAAAATRRLKELLEARKVSPKDNMQGANTLSQSNEKALQQWLDQELEVVVRVHEVRAAYEKQNEARAAMAKELSSLKEEEHSSLNHGDLRTAPTMSPSARRARIGLIESMLNASSSALVAMASQLSEAEERERAFTGRARWQNLRTIGDLRNMLNLAFNTAAFSRCQLRDKELENKELRQKIRELSQSLKQSETRRMDYEREMARQHHVKEQSPAVVLAASKAAERGMNELSVGLAQLVNPGRKLQYGIPYDLRKVSRGFTMYKGDTSESSECETDMEIEEADQSDKDWDEDDEKYAARYRKLKKNSTAGRKSSYIGAVETHQLEDIAFRTPAEVQTSSDISSDGEQQKPKGCCTCSQTSGCKTKKCECRQAGGLCGVNCSCKATKCANREAYSGDNLVDDEPSSADAAAASSSVVQDRAGDLAKHGAVLLDTAFKEELSAQISSSSKVASRRPLSDIGNTRVTISVHKQAKHKRKSQKPVVQLVAVDEQPTTEAPTNTNASENRQVPHTVEEVVQQQQTIMVPVSPLRARNRHRTREEGGVKRVVSAPQSPKKPGDEKENIR